MIKQIALVPENEYDWGRLVVLHESGELWALEFRRENGGGMTWVKLPSPPCELNASDQ